MYMKKFPLLLLISLLVSTTLFQSCNDDDDDYYVYYSRSLAVGNVVSEEGKPSYLLLDSKRTMLFSENSIPSLYLEDGRRVIVNYTLLDEDYQGYDFRIHVNDIDTVLVKGIIPITPEKEDSIGNDAVNILDMWTSDEYVTIQFEMKGAGQKKHMVNLVRDYSLEENPDDGYMQLEFRHNQEDDPEFGSQWLWGIASFRLGDLAPDKSDLKGLKIKVNTYRGEETYTCKYDTDNSEKNKAVDKLQQAVQKKNSSLYIR